jgi:hypothetical protein
MTEGLAVVAEAGVATIIVAAGVAVAGTGAKAAAEAEVADIAEVAAGIAEAAAVVATGGIPVGIKPGPSLEPQEVVRCCWSWLGRWLRKPAGCIVFLPHRGVSKDVDRGADIDCLVKQLGV